MPRPSSSLTLGARYTHENVSNDGYNTSGAQVLNYVNGSASFNNFSPRFTAFYAIDDQTNLYATVSRGFKAGGVEAQPVAEGGNQIYKPETLWNYEFGVKSESADKRLRLDADVFFMNWKDIQADYSIGQVLEQRRVLHHRRRQCGLRAQLRLRNRGDRAGRAAVSPSAPARATTGPTTSASRTRRAGSARPAISRAPRCRIPPSGPCTPTASTRAISTADQSGFLRLEWHYKGGIVSDQNSEFHTGFPWDVPSYNVWNLRAGYTRDNWTVTAFDENFLNKKYYTNAYEKAFVDGMFIEPGYRNIGVRLTVRTK